MSERAITALAYATLVILCIAFFWGAATMTLEAIRELQAIHSLQTANSRGSN